MKSAIKRYNEFLDKKFGLVKGGLIFAISLEVPVILMYFQLVYYSCVIFK